MTSLVRVAEKSRFCRFGRQQVHDAAHVGPEAHVEHAVGLVEHQHLDLGEVHVAALMEVEQTARGRDEEVDAAAQLLSCGS